MVGGEKVVEAGRTDEVLVEPDQLGGVVVGEVEVEVDDVLRRHLEVVGDEPHYPSVVLAEHLGVLLKLFLELLLDHSVINHRTDVGLFVGSEGSASVCEVDCEVGHFQQRAL